MPDIIEDALEGMREADSFAVGNASVEIKVVIGTAQLRVRDLLKLGRGAVVELDHTLNDPIDVYAEGILVAHGDIVIIDDKIGVTLTGFVMSGVS